MILSVSHISKSFNENPVLSDVTFGLEKNEKAAIVGINGAGKTTLLRIIMGESEPDSGTITRSKDLTVGYLAQIQNVTGTNTIREELLSVRQDLLDMEERLTEMEHRFSAVSGAELDALMESYTKLQTTYNNENGPAYRGEVNGVLNGLGFRGADVDQKIGTLSGGQKTRVALGKILLGRPDLIILDEPTNHLDIPSVEWLEGFLVNYRGAVLIVSHDRYFLDKVVTKVVELENTHCTVFNGNYTWYAEEKKELREQKLHAWLNNQAEIRHQEEVIKKLRQFNREKSIRRAESREKMLSRMPVVERPEAVNDEMKIVLRPCIQSGNDVLHVEDLAMGFDGKELFRGIGFDIRRGEHVAIIGENGTGKTTMLKIINGLLPPLEGTLRTGVNVHIGYYDQEHHVLNDRNTVFEEISDQCPYMTNTEIRNVLARFLFTGEDVFKPVSALSGGEKGRVSLAKLMLSEANFLILDEPTNHLDIVSKEVLENALNAYEGTVLCVSHDRYFINHTASRILSLTHEVLLNYPGNTDLPAPDCYQGAYDLYLEKSRAVETTLLRNAGVSVGSDTDTADTGMKGGPGSTSGSGVRGVSGSGTAFTGNVSGKTSGGGTAAAQTASALDWKAQKEEQAALRKKQNALKKCESDIAALEARNAAIDAELSDPANGSNVKKLNDLTKERASNDASLEALYADWETLSEALSS